jgi:addiction module HigA family antidote
LPPFGSHDRRSSQIDGCRRLWEPCVRRYHLETKGGGLDAAERSIDRLDPAIRHHECRLAKAIKVPPRRINEIARGKRGVTADTALRLVRFFRTDDPQFGLNLQTLYDRQRAMDATGRVIKAQVTPYAA